MLTEVSMPASGTTVVASGAASGTGMTPVASGVNALGAATSAPLSVVELPGWLGVSSELPQAATHATHERSAMAEGKGRRFRLISGKP